MTAQKHVVSFVNQEGHTLFGILHEPAGGGRRDVAIVLLSPGVKNRVAPHRLYNKLADVLTELGFWVARFDFCGLGDSEGTLDEKYLANLYGAIQVGRYVGDTRAIMDWLGQSHGFKRFIVAGLCGGAITGLLAGAADARVAALVSLGIPVMLDGSDLDARRYMTTGQLGSVRAGYLKKLTNPRAWLRVLKLQTDFGLLVRSWAAVTRRRPAPPSGPSAPAAAVSNTNPLFAPAFLQFLASARPVLLLFSGADRLYWEFEEKFVVHHRQTVAQYQSLIDLQIVADANHVLTFAEWQLDTMNRLRGWLLTRFPASGDLRAAPVSPRSAALAVASCDVTASSTR
jgi:uncharacterized protein